MYRSDALSARTTLSSSPPLLPSFSSPQTNCSHSAVTPQFPLPILPHLPVLDTSEKWTRAAFAFCIGLLMFKALLCYCTWRRHSCGWLTLGCIAVSRFVSPLVCWWTWMVYLLAPMNNAAVNVCLQVCWSLCSLGQELLGHMINLTFNVFVKSSSEDYV